MDPSFRRPAFDINRTNDANHEWHRNKDQRQTLADDLQVGKILVDDLWRDKPIMITPLTDKGKSSVAKEGVYAFLVDEKDLEVSQHAKKIYVRGPCEYVSGHFGKLWTKHYMIPVHKGRKIVLGGELIFDSKGCLIKWNNGSGHYRTDAEVAFILSLPLSKYEPLMVSISTPGFKESLAEAILNQNNRMIDKKNQQMKLLLAELENVSTYFKAVSEELQVRQVHLDRIQANIESSSHASHDLRRDPRVGQNFFSRFFGW